IVMHGVDHVVETLQRLQRLGVRIAIDDFGTGYSSFAYLRDLPIDTVKIDKSFVKDLGSPLHAPQFALALVEAITHVAKHLDLVIVAEGIETESQRQVLLDLGCQLGQGYLFSRPLPPEQMRPFLRLPRTEDVLVRDTLVN
ncbi:MAG: EAL domain-containing protein, partial [Solirubrobacterales bacterium]|nr:EAL domain-containing protein [Solirubrobacterales bacterium]